MTNDNPLVKVLKGRGQYVKMRLKDAEELGLEYEFERRPPKRSGTPQLEAESSKGRAPEGNKMRVPGEDKAQSSKLKADSKEEIASLQDASQSTASLPRNDKMANFTEIDGIGKATNRKLHDHGIHTFEALKAADVGFLPGSARKAVEKWREQQ